MWNMSGDAHSYYFCLPQEGSGILSVMAVRLFNIPSSRAHMQMKGGKAVAGLGV
jgi:hypothetical protein